MGFSITNEQSLAPLEDWLTTRSYIDGYAPSQADVAVLKVVTFNVNAAKFPNVTRWRRHLKTFEDEYPTLSGDASKLYTAYGSSAAAAAEADDDEDVDLFGSDDEEEDAEAAKVREQRLADYGTSAHLSFSWTSANNRSGKEGRKDEARGQVDGDAGSQAMGYVPSCALYILTRADDETDMKALEAGVRSIEKDGLVWGGSKLVPVGYGIRKLQINLVVEDEKVSLDELQEEIQEQEDYVQSTDVVRNPTPFLMKADDPRPP
jgi:elongation factor 1-beta